jgi:hypothetical protein
MARVLFLFLDGVGLGAPDLGHNPFAAANMPTLESLLGGQRLLAEVAPWEGPEASLAAVDAKLGVDGVPQSATGQAAILTGRNVPQELGRHYGPKPNPTIAAIVQDDNLFGEILHRGGTAALLNAYPPRYFQGILSRRRLYSAIPLAATSAGLPLMTAEDLQAGRALSADFTGRGWAAQPGFPKAPIYTPHQAGALLADLSLQVDLAWFDYWPSDYVGHRGSLREAVPLLETFDAVLRGLVEAWQGRQDLIVVTSDHGNLEDLSRRGHTANDVPALLIGPPRLRRTFARGLRDLTQIRPAVLRTLFDEILPPS